MEHLRILDGDPERRRRRLGAVGVAEPADHLRAGEAAAGRRHHREFRRQRTVQPGEGGVAVGPGAAEPGLEEDVQADDLVEGRLRKRVESHRSGLVEIVFHDAPVPARPVALEGVGIAHRPAALGEDRADRGPVVVVEGKTKTSRLSGRCSA